MKRYLFLAMLALGSVSSFAFTPDLSAIESKWVEEKYPESAQWTEAEAEKVLAEVSSIRSESEQLANYSKNRCQSNFFVNSCVDDVRKARMRAEQRFIRIEVHAKRIVREAKAKKHGQEQKERDAKFAKGPAGAKIEKNGATKPVTAETEHARKRAEQIAERKKKMDEMKAREGENLDAYEKRLADQKKRQAKREQALKKREQKKAEKAKKEAKGS